MKNVQVKILVAIRLSHASWRDFLSGFLRIVRTYPHWVLRIVDPVDVCRALDDEHIDGLVIGDINKATAEKLSDLAIPTIVIGSQNTDISKRSTNIAFLHNDDEAIGREGAKILATLGIRNSWGFVPHQERTHWSNLREKGFVGEMKSRGESVSVFKQPLLSEPKKKNLRLQRWLQALPKPAAIMGAYDAIAVTVLEICKSSGIEVPEQIAVIGVDNDQVLCEASKPALSSIAPDHMYEGELAATTLVKILRRKTSRPSTILCTRKKFVLRESSQATKPAAMLLRRALIFIKENATSKITAADVAQKLGVSRQLVELRFREFSDKTLAGTIRDVRLKEVRRQLRASQQTIRTIAQNCGWANVNHLENVFKRHFGISMREYRAQSI